MDGLSRGNGARASRRVKLRLANLISAQFERVGFIRRRSIPASFARVSRNDDPSAKSAVRITPHISRDIAMRARYIHLPRIERVLRRAVLTVFRLDRVERGPCQIPAS